MKTATLQQLDISQVPFPSGFDPNFCTKDAAEGHDGIWHVHEAEPEFEAGRGVAFGRSYEIGIDPTPDLKYTPEIGKDLRPEQSLFKIIHA
jgi:hypothetical protein